MAHRPVSDFYEWKEGKWCEEIVDFSVPLARITGGKRVGGWCNADPSAGTISLRGAVLRFDETGALWIGNARYGQIRGVAR